MNRIPLPNLVPPDGFTDAEEIIIRSALSEIYMHVPDPMTKFIIAAHFECGYTQCEVADMLKVSQPLVVKKIKRARAILEKLHLRNIV